jgi:hypothetical protein
MVFFPITICGPICRMSAMIPQFCSESVTRLDDLARGFQRIANGVLMLQLANFAGTRNSPAMPLYVLALIFVLIVTLSAGTSTAEMMYGNFQISAAQLSRADQIRDRRATNRAGAA